MAEEETEAELEAAIAVYGSDCNIIHRSPPHLSVRLQPRTAYDISQQYVEAVLVIKASAQYPRKPPVLELKDTKGLEEGKVALLVSELDDLANELICNPMLVAICEAALDRLTEMNQPDGNCCFCMEPLVMEDESSEPRPFMKLLSCFHCFHSDCFGRWWRWVLQKQNLDNADVLHVLGLEEDRELVNLIASCEKLLGVVELKCPVCRKSINARDLASVWRCLAAVPALEQDEDQEIVQELEIMSYKSEVDRKSKFDKLFKAQQQCGGIIEPKKLEVLVPGMFISVMPTKDPSCSESREDIERAPSITQASESSSSSTDVAEAEPPLQDDNNLRLGEGNTINAQTGLETTESACKSNGQSNDKSQRKSRRPNFAGGKKGIWIKRNQ
eukprot:c20602_g1_i1 orf=188-1345(+)